MNYVYAHPEGGYLSQGISVKPPNIYLCFLDLTIESVAPFYAHFSRNFIALKLSIEPLYKRVKSIAPSIKLNILFYIFGFFIIIESKILGISKFYYSWI